MDRMKKLLKQTNLKVLLGFVLIVFLGACSTTSTIPLTIKTKTGEHSFRVELALDDESKAKGLMFRKKLDENMGMLFIWPEDIYPRFWMKNTLISLDLLFIDRRGKIVHIEKRAIPKSEKTLTSARPIRYVLEIGGGQTDGRHIEEGDRVEFHLP